jgi:hypothetical protein
MMNGERGIDKDTSQRREGAESAKGRLREDGFFFSKLVLCFA